MKGNGWISFVSEMNEPMSIESREESHDIQLREDALAIWHAAVAAVASDRLVEDNVEHSGYNLRIADQCVPLDQVDRIAVVGAGKAGAGMAAGLEAALGEDLLPCVTGWVNVPADCSRPLRKIHLHPARPAGVNEPTLAGVHGGEKILELVSSLQENDLCVCLVSGGGSALLPAPSIGVTLEQKVGITKHLSGAGANIQQLNTVRKQLSRIKGGGLARACRAGRMITLIISDVLGDPLDVIASGPTVADVSTPEDAIDVLKQFPIPNGELARGVLDHLQSRSAAERSATAGIPDTVTNVVIGNNALAVDAAGLEAERRGYAHAMVSAKSLEGEAEGVGEHLARMARNMRNSPGPNCLISGGEPTVTLADPALRGAGGRNQQLVLAALHQLNQNAASGSHHRPWDGIALLSGGTDGEDGPTDAAGAVIDRRIDEAARQRKLDIADYLRRNDAYRFFEQVEGLVKTGPTHTNVCDVRVVVVDKKTALRSNEGPSQ